MCISKFWLNNFAFSKMPLFALVGLQYVPPSA